jgi:hypothetical protein
MILSSVVHIPAAVSLGVIIAIIAATAGLSLVGERHAAAGQPSPAAKHAERIGA